MVPTATAQARIGSIPYALPPDALEGLLRLAAHVALTDTASLFLQQDDYFWVLASSGTPTEAAHTAALLLPDIVDPNSALFVCPDASAGPEPVTLLGAALCGHPGFVYLHRFPVGDPVCQAVLCLAHPVARPQIPEETEILLSEISRQIALRLEARAEKRELEANRDGRAQIDRFLLGLGSAFCLGQCLVNTEGRLLSLSAGLEELLGLKSAQVAGSEFERVFAFETAFQDDVAQGAASHIPWDRIVDTACFCRLPGGGLAKMLASALRLRTADNADAWCVMFRRADHVSDRSAAPAIPVQKVLIAEDHPVNQRVIQGMVEKLGLSADVVTNGLEAVHAVCHETYAAILMDCQMPDMDGIEATRFIRSNEDSIGRVPIIAVTAFGHEEDRLRCLEAGVDEFMVKPIRMEALAAVLNRYTAVQQAPTTAIDSHSPEAQREVLDAIKRLATDLDEELVREVVGLFVEDTGQRIQEMRTLSTSQEREQLRNAAHKIKGSCGSLGARSLMAECEALENLARQGQRENIEMAIARISEQFDAIAPVLRKYLAGA